MSKQDWFKKLGDNLHLIIEMVYAYHPAKNKDRIPTDTDIAAEVACEVVRRQIRREYSGNPVEELIVAYQNKDVSKAYSIMSATWFGIPERESSRSIPGFFKMCNLLDDVPEA